MGSTSSSALLPGKRVVLHGLRKRPEINGQIGILIEPTANGSRWMLRLERDVLGINECHVKTRNLRAVGDSQPLAPPAHASDVTPVTPQPGQPVRLTTYYNMYAAQPVCTISELFDALPTGQRAFVLGGFRVTQMIGFT